MSSRHADTAFCFVKAFKPDIKNALFKNLNILYNGFLNNAIDIDKFSKKHYNKQKNTIGVMQNDR